MMLRNLSVAVLAALAMPSPSFAAIDDDTDVNTLDEVIVTAHRAPVAERDVLAAVEVIDRDEIERSQANSLPDLLRGRAGLTVANQGGMGKLTSVFLRGAESDQVLVLVDGVRIGSVTSGQAAFQDLPIDLIERIEIVRGPRSSLYGSEAVGGVIQIFTRRGDGAARPRASVGLGSNETRKASVGVGGGSANGWYSADYSWQRTEGFNACYGAGFPVFAGCFTSDEPDRDGHENHALSLRGGVKLGGAWSLDGHALESRSDTEFDGSFANSSETRQRVVGASATWRASDAANVRLWAGRNVDAADYFANGAYVNTFDTHRDSAGVQSDFAIAPGQRLTVGLDWLRDAVDGDTYVDANTGATIHSRRNTAGFLQYQGRLGAQLLQAAVRHDDNEQFGGHTTGNLAWGLEFASDWRISAGYGTAFKAPTFNDLYFPFGGNPNLRPERSRTAELGVAWRRGSTQLRLDGFETRVTDLVAYDFMTWTAANIQRARLRGAELGLETAFAGWSLDGSVSLLDPRNEGGTQDGNVLPRRARRSARIDLDRSFGAFRLGFTGIGEGERYDNLANTRRHGGFGTLDVRAEYAIAADWALQARVANVFDRDYETVAFYNQPGREWFLTLRYAPRP